MSIVTIIIGLVVLALFALPFILSDKGRKETEKRLLAALKTLAAQHNTTVAEHDFATQFAIGLSSDGQYALFIKTIAENTESTSLQLPMVQACRSNTVTHIVKVGKNTESVLDRLELVFQFKNTDTPALTWVLFDAQNNLQLNDEIELMRRWEKRLNIALREAKKLKQ